MRVLIVDDEDPARELLREYLGREADVEVAGECRNGFEAVKAVAELRPDLVLLDIQMPKLTGFEVLELIGREVAVIFVTAFDEHAARVRGERGGLPAQARRSRPVPRRPGPGARPPAARAPLPVAEIVQSARPPGAKGGTHPGAGRGQVVVIAAGDLDYAEAQDDYVGLHSKEQVHLKQQTLAELAPASTPRASCASTAPTCSTSIAWPVWRARERHARPFSPTGRGCPSAAPGTRASRRCSRDTPRAYAPN
jgi:two-component system LytT family response regulator